MLLNADYRRTEMKFVTVCFVLLVAAFGAVGLAGQGSRPNFSGTWIAAAPEQGNRQLTIKHQDSTLSIETQPEGTKHTLTLDGSETEMNAPDGKPLRVKAVWHGNALVVTVRSSELKQDIRRQTWMLDADGQLVMETEFLGGKPQPPVKTVFKRR
jgi:hypothetical protein